MSGAANTEFLQTYSKAVGLLEILEEYYKVFEREFEEVADNTLNPSRTNSNTFSPESINSIRNKYSLSSNLQEFERFLEDYNGVHGEKLGCPPPALCNSIPEIERLRNSALLQISRIITL